MAKYEILNPESTVEDVKEHLSFLVEALDFNSSNVSYCDSQGNQITDNFLAVKRDLDQMYGNRFYERVSQNCLFILGSIPSRLKLIQEKIKLNSEYLYSEIGKLLEANEQLAEELSERESELKLAQEKLLDQEKESINSKFEALQSQMLALQSQMFTKPQANSSDSLAKSPTSYFNDPIIEPIGEEVRISESTEKFDLINQVHLEILELLKSENLYPIHKIDPESAKKKYLEYWELSILNHSDLSIQDCPSFIESLELYVDKADNYFDTISSRNVNGGME
jgi:hypothetical protein